MNEWVIEYETPIVSGGVVVGGVNFSSQYYKIGKPVIQMVIVRRMHKAVSWHDSSAGFTWFTLAGGDLVKVFPRRPVEFVAR